MPFVEFLGAVADRVVSRQPDCAIDWWVSGPASRHHELSSLFDRVVRLAALDEAFASGEAGGEFVVDSPAMRRVVADMARSRGVALTIRRERPWHRWFVARIRARLSPLRSAARLIFDWAVVRLVVPRPRLDEIGPMVLLDTFVLPSAVESDRYYPGLFEFLDESEQRTVRLVPQFHGFTPGAMITAVRRLRSRASTYLLKESSLGFFDIVWVVGHLWRVRRLRVGSVRFADIDVGSLVEEDLRDAKSRRCAMQGLVNYRFAKRLAALGARVRVAIDWFENHPMDRGWNAGFRRFFPGTILKGYQGFYPSFAAARPAPHERAAGVLPDEIVTIGESLSADVTEFDAVLRVSVGPALRYRYIADAGPVDPAFARHVLVVLPYDRAVVARVLARLGALDERLADFQWVLKPHPANDLAAFGQLRDRYLPRAGISTDALDRAVSDCALVVGGVVATSSLEVIAMGRPYVSIVEPGMAALHVAPMKLDADALVCVGPDDDLVRVIRTLADVSTTAGHASAIAARVRADFFHPVDRSGVEQLLAL